MAKKVATSVVSPAATEPAPTTEKKVKAPRAKKVPATKPVAADGDAKKRNMSAVSAEFVSAVHINLSEDLKSKLKIKDVKEICEAFVKNLVDNVKSGKTVNFTNHMSFARKMRAARSYKNLKTQEKIDKPAHFVFTMTVKPNLKKQFDVLPVA